MVTDEQLARIARTYDTQMARALREALREALKRASKTENTPRANGRRA